MDKEMKKVINIILMALCTQLFAGTKIEIINGRPKATLDTKDSEVLYQQLDVPVIPIALGYYKEFRLQGSASGNIKNANDLNIECAEVSQTKTYECIIDITKSTCNHTLLIDKNGYFNLVINYAQYIDALGNVLKNYYSSTDSKVIIDCINKPKCYVALAFPPPAKKPKKNPRNNFCTLF